MVDEREQQAERDEAARGQYREHHGVRVDVLDRDVAPHRQRTRAHDLAHRGDEGEGEREADPRAETVGDRVDDPVLACERLGAAENDAVHHDERNEYAKRLGQRRQERLHQQVDRRDERRNYHDVARNVHSARYHLPEKRHQRVRAHEHERRGKPHPESIFKGCGHRERGTEPQHQTKRGIVLENPVPECKPCLHGG